MSDYKSNKSFLMNFHRVTYPHWCVVLAVEDVRERVPQTYDTRITNYKMNYHAGERVGVACGGVMEGTWHLCEG